MNQTLIIENVDLELLEKQRLILSKFMMNIACPDSEVIEALDCILTMLDEWSDIEEMGER